MSGQLFDYAFKIALIGDAGVGKSALMARYVRGRFIDGNRSTVGVDYATKTLVVDNLRIKVWYNDQMSWNMVLLYDCFQRSTCTVSIIS